MSYEKLKNAYKQTKSRERVRSTVFDDDTDKADRRQQRRLTERKEIETALEEELDVLDGLYEDYDLE